MPFGTLTPRKSFLNVRDSPCSMFSANPQFVSSGTRFSADFGSRIENGFCWNRSRCLILPFIVHGDLSLLHDPRIFEFNYLRDNSFLDSIRRRSYFIFVRQFRLKTLADLFPIDDLTRLDHGIFAVYVHCFFKEINYALEKRGTVEFHSSETMETVRRSSHSDK